MLLLFIVSLLALDVEMIKKIKMDGVPEEVISTNPIMKVL
jgi:hypothetical protein